jgi:phosphatidylserine decarboxylase
MRLDKFPLASPGWPYIAACLLLAAVATALSVWVMAIPLWLILLLMINFFRDPARHSQAPERAVISPADGKVVAIEPRAGGGDLPPGDWRVVSIFMNIFDVHVNRAPAGGRVERIVHHPGGYVPADRPEAATGNERLALHLETPYGPLVVVQVAGLVARRIECHLAAGDPVARGQRYGMIRFGSRLDVYLPASATVSVKPGDRVRAGVTPIGEF